jgi:O-antigen/teichoic acid export membrane protein
MVTVINITLSACFIHLFGFIGAPLGTALSMALGTFYMIKKINSYFGRSLSDTIFAVRRPLLTALPTALLCMIIMETLDNGRIMELAG